jgi:hypothetical protein
VFFSVSIVCITGSLSGQTGNHTAKMVMSDQSQMWDISYSDYSWKSQKEILLSLQTEKERISKLISGQSSGEGAYLNACFDMTEFLLTQVNSNATIETLFPNAYKTALSHAQSVTDITDKSFSPFFIYPSHLLKVLLVSDTDLK